MTNLIKVGDFISIQHHHYRIKEIKKNFTSGWILFLETQYGLKSAITVQNLNYSDSFNLRRFSKTF